MESSVNFIGIEDDGDATNICTLQSDAGPSSITFGNVVTVYNDGRVEVHEGVGTDEAARAFWQAVREAAPGFLD